MQPYDLIVIGSGPGGQRAAIQGAKAGKRVGVIEKQTSIGGVCINIGTIPSKTMREAVLHLSGFYDKNFYGSNYNVKENVTMADLNFRVQHVVESEVGVTQNQLKRNGVDVIHGVGRFIDAHHIRVENSNGFAEFKAEYVVIGTGTKPSVNPKVPINGRNIINSDQILSMAQLPKTLIVVGGGVIGVEYACMFATLGVRVIIVEKRPRLLEFADVEMVDADYRTSQPHIFAVGDVIGFPSLASVSMEQGRIAAARAFKLDVHTDPAGYPYGIYTIPQISFIGKTEEQLTDSDVPYEVGIAYY